MKLILRNILKFTDLLFNKIAKDLIFSYNITSVRFCLQSSIYTMSDAHGFNISALQASERPALPFFTKSIFVSF